LEPWIRVEHHPAEGVVVEVLGDFSGGGVEDPADASQVVGDEAVGDAVLDQDVGGVGGAVDKGGEDLAGGVELGQGLGAVAVKEALDEGAVDLLADTALRSEFGAARRGVAVESRIIIGLRPPQEPTAFQIQVVPYRKVPHT
jgi:hypothetical protein